MNPFEIGVSIRQITRNIKQFVDQGLKDSEINEGQYEYFFMIYRNNGINQKELAEIMHVSKASVTKAIKKLLSTGFIERIKDKDDLRNYGLYVTEEGKKFAKRFEDYAVKIHQVMFLDISDEEIEILYSIITRIKENSQRL